MIHAMQTCTGLGVMSGTSMDGVDLAHCRFQFQSDSQTWKYKILAVHCEPYPKAWKIRLRELPRASGEEMIRAHVDLGHYYADVIRRFIGGHRLKPQWIGCHGQTVFHQPNEGWTFQAGCGETMAATLPCPVVTNFRAKDVALGGQGAPLVSFAEPLLFPGRQVFLNLGGVANLTANQQAMDVCVCNMALNELASKHNAGMEFDDHGQIARSGKVNVKLLERLNSLPYFQQPPPKSLGREWYESHMRPLLLSSRLPIKDRLATTARHVALQIGKALDAFQIKNQEILATGGGFHNSFLMECLEKEFARNGNGTAKNADPRLVDFKEAMIFAFLGCLTLLGRTNVSARITGAVRDSVSGAVHLPVSGAGSISSSLAS